MNWNTLLRAARLTIDEGGEGVTCLCGVEENGMMSVVYVDAINCVLGFDWTRLSCLEMGITHTLG